jgi:hypothetical protein
VLIRASTLSFSPMVKTSGKGNRGVVGIQCHLQQHILQERTKLTTIFQAFTKNQDEPKLRGR